MRKITFLAMVLTLMALSGPAQAAVTFDAETSTGFVGKGDVQLLYGWNNKTLQANASAVTFEYESHDKYEVTCEWETVTGGKNSKTIPHDATIKRNINLNAQLDGDPRLTRGQQQFTGFIIDGIYSSNSPDSAPEVGDSCPMAHESAVVTEVFLMSSTGGLYVEHNDIRHLLQ